MVGSAPYVVVKRAGQSTADARAERESMSLSDRTAFGLANERGAKY